MTTMSGESAAAQPAREPGCSLGHGQALAAARRVIEANRLQVTLPGGAGALTLPSPQLLAWCAGLTAVAALGFIEWPVAGVLMVGHLLAEDNHHRLLKSFGQALSDA